MKRTVCILLSLVVLLSAVSAMAADKVVVVPLGGPTGDAVAADVLEGRTFSNKDDVGIDGAMVNNGAQTLVPGTAPQTVPEGYHDGSGTVQGDADLLPGNIKSGANIFGVGGTAIEASGTATADQVLADQTFSNASGAATGSMPNVGAQTITPGTGAQTITQGYHNGSGSVPGDAELVTGNIKSGITIFGVAGDSNVVDTSSGDAAAGDLLSGKKAWVDGSIVTGSIPTQTLSNTTTVVSAGYYSATDLAAVNTDLDEYGIACGTTIFGITGISGGTFSGTRTVCSVNDQVWMDRNLGASRVATSMTDPEAYGDLYQWGRLADGHQSRTSPTTTTLSNSDTPGHGSFIFPSGVAPYDWRSPQNDSLWQGVTGINNPCPAGFRLPTDVELDTERLSWSSQNAFGAFASPLKLVRAGFRDTWNTPLADVGSVGYYWSSTVSGLYSRYLYFHQSYVTMYDNALRARGYSVRCLKD